MPEKRHVGVNILVGSEKGQNNSSEDEIENIRSEKAKNITLDEEKMAEKSNETEKVHNETLKEAKKVNIHNGTEEQEDESPEVKGEIKEEGGPNNFSSSEDEIEKKGSEKAKIYH